MVHLLVIYLLSMMMFHSYVSLVEDTLGYYNVVPPSYKLVYKPINYSYICHKP